MKTRLCHLSRLDEPATPVLQGVLGAEVTAMVVYPEREFLPSRVRAFVDRLVAYVETNNPFLPDGFQVRSVPVRKRRRSIA